MNLWFKELRKEDIRKRYSIAVSKRHEDLVDESDMDDLEKKWTCLKDTYVKAAEEIIPSKEAKTSKTKLDDEWDFGFDGGKKEV